MAELKAARPVDSCGVRCSSLADSSKEEDFDEIFGGLEASCSIPFLELPVGIEDPDGAKVGEGRFVNDYEEIFGGFAGVNLGVSCGEMTMPDDLSGRVPKKIIFGPQGVESSIQSSQWSDEDLVACLEKDQTLLDSDPSNDIKQFSMSHLKAVGRSIEQTTSDTKHVIQPNAILRHAFVAKACSSDNFERDSVSQMAAYGLNPKRISNGTITSGEKGKTSTPASKSIKNSMNDTNDLGQLNTNPPTSENDFVNLKPHLSSSSCHSTSSGGISSPEVTYATASDISLQTQPLFVSPPSRPPPKVAYKHSRPEIKMFTNTKDDVCEGGLLRKTNKSPKYWEGFSKGDTSQNSSSDSSPCFYDAEVDGSSAAVAAAAAMKEAIEQAQVRLKIARASMDRKRDSFKGGKNLVKSDSINCKDEEAEVVKTFGEDINRITTAKEDEEMKGIILQEMQKHWTATKIDSNHEEKESQAAEEEHALQGKKTKSSQSNLEERSGEWKIEKQACDEKFKMVQQVSEQENVEKEMIAKEDKVEQENKVGKIPFELKKTRKLWAVYESHELKNKINLNADILPSREEEIREIISAIRGVQVHEKTMNMIERAYDSSLEEETEEETEEKPEEARMVCLGVEDKAKQIDIHKTSSDEICEKKLEYFDHDSRYKKLHKFEEKNKNLETSKKVDRRQESKTKPYIASEPHESEKGRKLANKTIAKLRRNLNCRTDPVSQKRWRN